MCINGGEVQLAEVIIATAKALGGPASPNCHVYTSLAQGYCQAGQRQAAHNMVQVRLDAPHALCSGWRTCLQHMTVSCAPGLRADYDNSTV